MDPSHGSAEAYLECSNNYTHVYVRYLYFTLFTAIAHILDQPPQQPANAAALPAEETQTGVLQEEKRAKTTGLSFL